MADNEQVRTIFEKWWKTTVQARGQTKHDVLIDFIDTLVCDGKISKDDLRKWLVELYDYT